MESLEEKRVYGAKTAANRAFIAAENGITVVSIADGRVGEFRLAHQCSAVDIAPVDDEIAVATTDDILITDDFEPTGFGPAVAVGEHSGDLLGAGPNGQVARFDGTWSDIGTVHDVTAIDGPFVAAASGVFRLDATPTHVGLIDVTDISAAPQPLAATLTGLYALGNGWMDVVDGEIRVVAQRDDGRHAHAASRDMVYERLADQWQSTEVGVDEPIVGFDYAEGVYAITADGTLLIGREDGWRSQALGMPGVVGIAIPPRPN